ncbi:hypothetical protein [Candidatus Enterococcus leclercqii]|uniref:hypothetical protein n=1 Tax=Candidatus Enterococcus leclercqii TaxID=1857218 RepID=UPI00137A6F0B|nr:hypothetical protein [Enterococcus sp. CU9D]KAF1294171.1 hypothetical protein BAU14_07220 [Enterococcus sp. CU9D]
MFAFFEGYFLGRFITFILAAAIIFGLLFLLFQVLLVLLKVAAAILVGYGIFLVGKAIMYYASTNEQ